MDEPQGRIHRDHPFSTPPELREPARRFRGRLVSPVTIWTAGTLADGSGLTVSSMIVAEGESSSVFGLVGVVSDLRDAIDHTGAFVVHVLGHEDRLLADRFALRMPSPGGLFAGLDIEATSWGPAIAKLPTRVYCRHAESTDTGNHMLVRGVIEQVELDDLERPLTYFRGRYRRLESE